MAPTPWTVRFLRNAPTADRQPFPYDAHDSTNLVGATRVRGGESDGGHGPMARFLVLLREAVARADSRRGVPGMRERVLYRALLNIAEDHTASPFLYVARLGSDDPELEVEDVLRIGPLTTLLSAWDINSGSGSGAGRSAADKTAQRIVAGSWNDGRCLLSGMGHGEGAHLVPIRALDDGRPAELYRLLRTYWALPDLQPDQLVLTGHETCNIVPLTPTVHRLFDAYKFALWPLPDAADPAHRLAVQVVVLRQDNPYEYGLFADVRRAARHPDTDADCCPLVQDGDVFEITTADPVNCPLPDVSLLRIQYGVHRIRAGLHAASALAAIFRGGPDEDEDAGALPTYDVAVPPPWCSLLAAAVETGVLTQAAADRCGRSFARDVIKDAVLCRFPLPGLPDEGRDEYEEALANPGD